MSDLELFDSQVLNLVKRFHLYGTATALDSIHLPKLIVERAARLALPWELFAVSIV
jgi:hypothetical protein